LPARNHDCRGIRRSPEGELRLPFRTWFAIQLSETDAEPRSGAAFRLTAASREAEFIQIRFTVNRIFRERGEAILTRPRPLAYPPRSGPLLPQTGEYCSTFSQRNGSWRGPEPSGSLSRACGPVPNAALP
jgi:hypothetical protein